MMIVLNVVLIAAMAAVVLVIFLGLTTMGGGNPQRTQKLMQMRVAFQFAAILIAIAIVALNAR